VQACADRAAKSQVLGLGELGDEVSDGQHGGPPGMETVAPQP
jgi:hypothetical protein